MYITSNRCQSCKKIAPLKNLMEHYWQNYKLTEDIIDSCQELSTGAYDAETTSLYSAQLFVVTMTYNVDISCVRAVVEKFADDLFSDSEMKNYMTGKSYVMFSFFFIKKPR